MSHDESRPDRASAHRTPDHRQADHRTADYPTADHRHADDDTANKVCPDDHRFTSDARFADARFADALAAALDLAADSEAPLTARERAVEIACCLAETAADEATATRMLRIVEADASEGVLLPLLGSLRGVLGDRYVGAFSRMGARAFERQTFSLLAEIVTQVLRYRPWELEAIPSEWAEAAILHAIKEHDRLGAGHLVDLCVRAHHTRAPWLHAILEEHPELVAHAAVSHYAVLMLQLVNPTAAGCRRLAREALSPRTATAAEWLSTSSGRAALARALAEETDIDAKRVLAGWLALSGDYGSWTV